VREKGEGLECDDGGGAEEFAACALGDHLARGGGVAVEDAVDWTVVSILSASVHGRFTVDFEHVLEVLLGEVQQCFDLCDAGIRNHGVERAKFRHRGLNQIFDLFEVGYIGSECKGFPTQSLDFLDNFVAARLVGFDVVDAYVVAVVGQSKSDSFTASNNQLTGSIVSKYVVILTCHATSLSQLQSGSVARWHSFVSTAVVKPRHWRH
jgi:hypothetical protein